MGLIASVSDFVSINTTKHPQFKKYDTNKDGYFKIEDADGLSCDQIKNLVGEIKKMPAKGLKSDFEDLKDGGSIKKVLDKELEEAKSEIIVRFNQLKFSVCNIS